MAKLDFGRPAVRDEWQRRLEGLSTAEDWEKMAGELFGWHYAQVPAYRRLAEGSGVSPENLTSWKEIPAVPQQLFKLEKLFAHGRRPTAKVFETSGTTTGQPGRHHLLRDDVYRTVSFGGAEREGLLPPGLTLHFLTPSPKAAPHSSLSTMFGYWAQKTGAGEFWVQRNHYHFDGFRVALRGASKPVGIAGTAFSFVHLLEAWADLPALQLPHGSWLLETGGFKGRAREVAKPELYAQLARVFSLPTDAIWNEYGMCELSSQAYARGVKGLHRPPPWARVLIWNPATGREARAGERGLVRWYDLANVDSVMGVQTLDVAVRRGEAFQLTGRLPRTEPRGCSLSADDLSEGAT